MLNPLYSDCGIASPNDLRSLSQAFDRICSERRIGKQGHEGEEVAHAIMSLFAAGIVSEDEIVARLMGRC